MSHERVNRTQRSQFIIRYPYKNSNKDTKYNDEYDNNDTSSNDRLHCYHYLMIISVII